MDTPVCVKLLMPPRQSRGVSQRTSFFTQSIFGGDGINFWSVEVSRHRAARQPGLATHMEVYVCVTTRWHRQTWLPLLREACGAGAEALVMQCADPVDGPHLGYAVMAGAVQRCLSQPMIGYGGCCNETQSSPPFCRKKPSQNWSTGMRTDSELRAEGMSARINARGLVEAERFIASLSRESFDYTEWWCPHLPLMSVAQISAAASGEH